jgi:2-polyprenyl-6-methoxyphenol hydroxylase-like FAD-dependent oxidoreductase
MAFGMAPGGHWLGYLVAGPDDALNEGNRWYNWGWYRTADEDSLQDHLTDANGEFHHSGIPAHLIRKEIINAMREEAKKFLAPQIEKVIESTANPFLQPMYDFSSKQLVFNRTILIGDAAFTARPHVGMGVSKAAFDASSLAQALSQNNPASLKEWESARLKFGKAAVQWGRDLGSYLGPKATDPVSKRKGEYYMRPETLLSVTAASEPQQYLRMEA